MTRSAPPNNYTTSITMSSLSRELADLGPLFQVQETLVTQGAGAAEVTLCGTDARRWALFVSVPNTSGNAFTVSTVPGHVSKGGGLQLVSGQTGGGGHFERLELDFRRYGTAVQGAWYGGIPGGVGPSGPIVWTVLEILLLN